MSWRIEHQDALTLLKELPDKWAQTCVTSPPYWGLRDYGLPPATWGGKPGCRHTWTSTARRGEPARETRSRGGRFCERCHAWRGCLGLEPSPELYLEHLLTVLAEAHRVLRDDGSLWLNLGDSYMRAAVACGTPGRSWGLKAKDLAGVPWRAALALQEQGWWLRSDVVWVKPNAMPENVPDRPTRAHEYLFLLTKQPRYYYDAHAVREPDTGRHSGNGYVRPGRLSYRDRRGEHGQHAQWRGGHGRNRRSWWSIAGRGYPGAQAVFPEKLVEPCILAGTAPTACGICGTPWQRDRKDKEHWQPGCAHRDSSGRCLVLDPFCGSATTGAVAARHGRDFLGVELNPATARLARQRLTAQEPTR